MTTKEVAQNFSMGEFSSVYDRIAEKAVWTVLGENEYTGKDAILNYCEQVSSYFRSVETKFATTHIIAEGRKVVVSGTAEFIRGGKTVSFISACDVYEFSETDQIEKISSYCIQQDPAKIGK